MKNCIVAQSGGPTTAINSSLLGVIKGVLNSNKFEKIYGSINGIEGIIKNRIIDLGEIFKCEKNQALLKQTPSSYLGSCRYKLPDFKKEPSVYKTIFEFFEKENIGAFFYIGGNDSMDTVHKLSDYAKIYNIDISFMGVPKTIDNDLPVTDHTPGFGSAAKYIASTVKEIGRDSNVYDLKSVTIVEIMGRNAGWLTAASVLARNEEALAPHLIYLPEIAFSMDEFIDDVKEMVEKYSNIVVCVSEGIKDKDGVYVCEAASSGLTDTFGHKYLSGTAKVLENEVRNRLGYKARGVELNVCQRCASHFSSLTDLNEAELIGKKAVEAVLNGESGKMMTFLRKKDFPYEIETGTVSISETANLEKTVPSSWITKNDVKEEFITYCKPLIMGEPEIITENGLPAHIILK